MENNQHPIFSLWKKYKYVVPKKGVNPCYKPLIERIRGDADYFNEVEFTFKAKLPQINPENRIGLLRQKMAYQMIQPCNEVIDVRRVFIESPDMYLNKNGKYKFNPYEHFLDLTKLAQRNRVFYTYYIFADFEHPVKTEQRYPDEDEFSAHLFLKLKQIPSGGDGGIDGDDDNNKAPKVTLDIDSAAEIANAKAFKKLKKQTSSAHSSDCESSPENDAICGATMETQTVIAAAAAAMETQEDSMMETQQDSNSNKRKIEEEDAYEVDDEDDGMRDLISPLNGKTGSEYGPFFVSYRMVDENLDHVKVRTSKVFLPVVESNEFFEFSYTANFEVAASDLSEQNKMIDHSSAVLEMQDDFEAEKKDKQKFVYYYFYVVYRNVVYPCRVKLNRRFKYFIEVEEDAKYPLDVDTLNLIFYLYHFFLRMYTLIEGRNEIVFLDAIDWTNYVDDIKKHQHLYVGHHQHPFDIDQCLFFFKQFTNNICTHEQRDEYVVNFRSSNELPQEKEEDKDKKVDNISHYWNDIVTMVMNKIMYVFS